MPKPLLHLIAAFLTLTFTTIASGQTQPNIVILLTDDQGFGDLGHTGNNDIRTPAIDAFAAESVDFTHFYVSPVCAPTRASLMTGRYNQRTGAIDTWKGGAIMAPDEFTLAEALQQDGYATGLFGKWHLGDTYPTRPQDQGFDEVVMHRGGGITQPSCPKGNSYFDPILYHNGEEKKYEGYCMDVYTDEAIAFIKENKDRPFFVYLATNTPHTPLQVPDEYTQPYLDAGLPEETSKIYGMMTNIDDNFERVLDTLDQLGLADNTIVIYMSDNGPKVFHQNIRHMAGMNGAKTDVYEAGIRTPFFLRWPARFDKPKTIDTHAAHIDLMPTLLEATGAKAEGVDMDGVSLMPLIENPSIDWPDRTFYIQWHRGYATEPYRNFTAVGTRYKLLQRNNKFDTSKEPIFELYDLQNDPGETTNIAADHPELVKSMLANYDTWLSDVSSTRGYPEFPAWLGTDKENPIVFTGQDRRGDFRWGNEKFYPEAYWPVRITQSGSYKGALELHNPAPEDGVAKLKIGDTVFTTELKAGDVIVNFPATNLEEGDAHMTAWVEYGSKKTAPHFIEVEYITQS